MPDRAPMTFVGEGSTAQLCDAIAETGTAKVLVVTDRGLVELGVVGRVVDRLAEAGVGVTIAAMMKIARMA